MTWKISLPRGFLGVIFTVFASSCTHAQVSQLRQFGLDAGRVTNIHFVKKG
jgi:hypothetical protein